MSYEPLSREDTTRFYASLLVLGVVVLFVVIATAAVIQGCCW